MVPLLRLLLGLAGLHVGQVGHLTVRLRRGADTAYLLLYVDNIVLTATSPELLQRTTSALQQQFVMDLNVSVEQWSNDLFLHQC
jgi:hypothetical protein